MWCTGPEGERNLNERGSHAMLERNPALTRLSRAWFALLRDSRGRVADRKITLADWVHSPARAKTWTEVPEQLRNWENHVIEYESLLGTQLQEGVKTQAILRLVPMDLRDVTLAQPGLEERYEQLRTYVLNMAGRRAAHPAETPAKPSGPVFMDCSRMARDPTEKT